MAWNTFKPLGLPPGSSPPTRPVLSAGGLLLLPVSVLPWPVDSPRHCSDDLQHLQGSLGCRGTAITVVLSRATITSNAFLLHYTRSSENQ